MSEKTEENSPETRVVENGKDNLGPNSEIGRKLKQYYDDLVAEEIPDRFADLLNQLENVDPAKTRG